MSQHKVEAFKQQNIPIQRTTETKQKERKKERKKQRKKETKKERKKETKKQRKQNKENKENKKQTRMHEPESVFRASVAYHSAAEAAVVAPASKEVELAVANRTVVHRLVRLPHWCDVVISLQSRAKQSKVRSAVR